jgi:hypothetical protein
MILSWKWSVYIASPTVDLDMFKMLKRIDIILVCGIGWFVL